MRCRKIQHNAVMSLNVRIYVMKHHDNIEYGLVELKRDSNQGCGVGSPVIRLLAISIIRLQLRLRPSAVLVT